MRLLGISLLVLFAAPLLAQERGRLPGNATTPAEQEGKRLFVQRCAVCHLPLTPEPRKAYGPLLNGLFKKLPDEEVRKAIAIGYGNMPGWQYTLSAAQLNNLIAFLKTFPD
jgi:mono/diheme cytochrome c family protein